MREHTVQLLFAGLAVALCIVERIYSPADDSAAAPAAAPQKTNWYSIWR
jgi:hypothetical protein